MAGLVAAMFEVAARELVALDSETKSELVIQWCRVEAIAAESRVLAALARLEVEVQARRQAAAPASPAAAPAGAATRAGAGSHTARAEADLRARVALGSPYLARALGLPPSDVAAARQAVNDLVSAIRRDPRFWTEKVSS